MRIVTGKVNQRALRQLWVGHTGTGASERSIVFVSPERNLGIVVLFNVIDVNREKYLKLIADQIKVENVKLSPFTTKLVSDARTFLNATPAPKTITPPPYPSNLKLDRFVGSYFADIAGQQDVTISEDGFLVIFGQKLQAEDAQNGKFRFPQIAGPVGLLFSREPINFEFDKSGQAVSMRVANVKIFRRL